MPAVSIVIETELGDSLLKMDLAKRGINDLGTASEETAAKQDAAALSTAAFSDALGVGGAGGGGGLIGMLTTSIPLFGGFSAPLIALPAIAFAASAAVYAVADAIGAVIAVAADFVAPMTVVTGLLALLGGGFVIAATKALGMHSDGLGQAVAGLKKQFNDLTTTLVGRFMPIFRILLHDASGVLSYFNKIAKMPLADAFKSLATTGVQAVTHFLEMAGHMLAKPIRLAFKIAFGTGPGSNEISSAVSGLWNQFTNFLFGYSQTHQIHIGRFLGPVTTSQVAGIFQPLIDWFDRHDFTKQGEKIGRQLLNGLRPLAHPIAQFIIHVLEDAVISAGKTWIDEFVHIYHYLETENQKFVDNVGKYIKDGAGAAAGWIERELGKAWTWVKTWALREWRSLVQAIESALTVHIIWPSPPGWVKALFPGISGPSTTGGARNPGGVNTGGRGGHGGTTGNIAMAAGGVHHYHMPITLTIGGGVPHRGTAEYRRFAADLASEITRRQSLMAGGR